MKPFITAHAVAASTPELDAPPLSVEQLLTAFFDGRSDGAELLRALYDHILDEPIPERLRAVLPS